MSSHPLGGRVVGVGQWIGRMPPVHELNHGRRLAASPQRLVKLFQVLNRGQGRSLEKKIEVEPFKRDIADETEIEPWRGAQLKRMAARAGESPVPVPVFIPVIAGKGSAAHIDRALDRKS